MLMKALVNLLKIWLYSLGLVCFGKSLYYFINSISIEDFYEFSFKGNIDQSIIVFKIAILVSLVIYSIVKIITSAYFMLYYGLYTESGDMIHIKVDENNIIRESFIEFKNGNKVPIEISRIVLNNPEESNGNEERK